MESISLTPHALRGVLDFHIKHAEPAIVFGQPGVGKSDIVRQTAEANGYHVINFDTTSSEATDIAGIPFPVPRDEGGHYLDRLPFRRLIERKDRIALFFDELLQGEPGVLAAVAPVFLERRMGDLVLPPDTWVIGATNRLVDRAGTRTPPSHLPNRTTVLTLRFDLASWKSWAYFNDMPEVLIGFAGYRPALLNQFDPASLVNATPRQWGWVGKYLDELLVMPEEQRLAILAGRVGEGPAAEFLAYHKVTDTLPTGDDILAHPTLALIPESGRIDQMFAVTAMAASRTNVDTVHVIATYMARLPPDFQVMWLHDVYRGPHGNRVSSTEPFCTLCAKYSVELGRALAA